MEAFLPLVTTQVYAGIGPCIGKASFVVDKEVFEQFSIEDWEAFCTRNEKQQFKVDLTGIAAVILKDYGVNVDSSFFRDTYLNHSYFSHRRATQEARVNKDPTIAGNCGRQISVIGL